MEILKSNFTGMYCIIFKFVLIHTSRDKIFIRFIKDFLKYSFILFLFKHCLKYLYQCLIKIENLIKFVK